MTVPSHLHPIVRVLFIGIAIGMAGVTCANPDPDNISGNPGEELIVVYPTGQATAAAGSIAFEDGAFTGFNKLYIYDSPTHYVTVEYLPWEPWWNGDYGNGYHHIVAESLVYVDAWHAGVWNASDTFDALMGLKQWIAANPGSTPVLVTPSYSQWNAALTLRHDDVGENNYPIVADFETSDKLTVEGLSGGHAGTDGDDVLNIQWAVDNVAPGGTVKLMSRTSPHRSTPDQPTAFRFGDYDFVTLGKPYGDSGKDIVIEGETNGILNESMRTPGSGERIQESNVFPEGTPITIISGGLYPFITGASDDMTGNFGYYDRQFNSSTGAWDPWIVPTNIKIQKLHFDGPRGGAVHISLAGRQRTVIGLRGAEIYNCKVTDPRGAKFFDLPHGYSKGFSFETSANDPNVVNKDDPHPERISGTIIARNNYVEGTLPSGEGGNSRPHGVSISSSLVSANILFENNEVRDSNYLGIWIARFHGNSAFVQGNIVKEVPTGPWAQRVGASLGISAKGAGITWQNNRIERTGPNLGDAISIGSFAHLDRSLQTRNCTARDNEVRGTFRNGIKSIETDEITIRNNEVDLVSHSPFSANAGILVPASQERGHHIIESNTVSGQMEYGLLLWFETGSVARKNDLSGGFTSYPVYLLGTYNSTIEANAISCSSPALSGIRLNSATGATIDSNTLQGTGQYGIDLYRSSGNSLSENDLSSFGASHYQVVDSPASSNNILTNNLLGLATLYGLYVFGDNNSFRNNVLSGSYQDGIVSRAIAGHGGHNVFSGNTISDFSRFGAVLLFASDNSFTDNDFASAHALRGLSLDRASNNTFARNDLSGVRAITAQVTIDSWSNNNVFSNNDYGPLEDLDAALAGFSLEGDNNTLTNETFWGSYPGIYGDPPVPCVWVRAAASGNKITTLKNGQALQGFDDCVQINLDNDNNTIPGYDHCESVPQHVVAAMIQKSAEFVQREQDRCTAYGGILDGTSQECTIPEPEEARPDDSDRDIAAELTIDLGATTASSVPGPKGY
jgi:parallel beta-helix repeat protein